jgi:hypothetical protein
LQSRTLERIAPVYSAVRSLKANEPAMAPLLASVAFALIFRDLLNETEAQSQFVTDTRNIPELGISENKAR